MKNISMKNRLSSHLLALLVPSCLLAASLTACSRVKTENPLPEIPRSAALFDYFDYKGADTYYAENPLPTDDSFYTPILPGWYSDPSVCTNGKGDYFLVTSTFTYFPGVPIFHSRDLVNWKQVGHVLNRPSQLVNMKGQHISGGIFAPAISYNPHNDTYYMVTTNVGAGNFYVKTKDPFGEWSDPIMLPEVGGIDPSIFFDEDGKAYIVNNDDAPDRKPEYDGHRTIRIQEFDWKNDRTVGERKIIVNKGVNPAEKPIWIEGPHVYKINGKYYLMDAEGGTSVWHSEVIFRADSPMGPYKPWDKNPILTQRHLNPQRANPITCAGHADLIQAAEGDWWAVFLACRPIDNKFENLGRETFLLPVRWSEDGFPYITQGDEEIPMIARRPGVKRDEKVTFGNFDVFEDFTDAALPMEWMTLRAPATDLYSLAQTPGYLTLKCSPVSAKEKDTPALVARRMQHHRFEASTRLLFSPEQPGESAGMILFKDERHHYYLSFSKSGEDKVVSLRQSGDAEDAVLASDMLPASTEELRLKVVSHGLTYDFHYAVGADGAWKLLCSDVDAAYLSTARCGGFTGSVIGLYALQE